MDNEIIEAVEAIKREIPSNVILLAAAKTRTLEEVKAVIEAGVTHIGYNYIQESLPIIQAIGNRATWHMIGHLQRNKVKIAVDHFNMIETLDSWELAQRLDRYCEEKQMKLPVLLEINSGKEANKTGVPLENIDELVELVGKLRFIQVKGLMTMGPRFGDPEDSRPYFQITRRVFERISSSHIPNVEMEYLSMGMSNSYQIAIEEGANIVRIGTKLFGQRKE